MKKFVAVLLAFIAAFFCNEFVVRYIIHYPTMNVGKRLYGLRDSEKGIQRISKPYAEYCNVENGYNIFHYNNFGIPGRDIDTSHNRINITILGSSFIEALQMPANEMAASIFQDSISRIDPRFQVLNLGHSGYDPYDLYFKIKYHEKYFHTDYVVLVLNETFTRWFDRHKQPFSFVLPKNFGIEIYSPLNSIELFLRNNFHSLNLFRELIAADSNPESASEHDKSVMPTQGREDLSRLFVTLSKFHELYSNRFVCISIISDSSSATEITEFCRASSINFISNISIQDTTNLIKGHGHLNKTGNKLLGNLLYETFKSLYIK
jgi:hypothetical protein